MSHMGSFLFLWDKEFLSQKQLENIKKHKYQSKGSSLLEPVFQKFWCSLVNHVPCWIAPNVLTLLGLAANFVACIPLMLHCPTFKEEPPAWALLFFAACFFVYQTLDAIDGKQARRIGLSSPMGELFDHGCDAANTVIVSLVYNCSLQLGLEPAINMYSFGLACFCFYLAHWLTYCTGVLHFGLFDITEAQVTIMSQLVITAVVGPQVWHLEVMVVGQLRILMAVIATLACVPAILSRLHVILIDGGCGRFGSTVADSSVLSPVKCILSMFVFMCLIQHRSQPPNVSEGYALLFYTLFGFYFAKITCVLIVAHMCKSELSFWDLTMWGPGIVCLNQYLNFPFPEHYILSIAVVWCAADWLIYVVRVLLQLSAALEIPILTVPPDLLEKFRHTSQTTTPAPPLSRSSSVTTTNSSINFNNNNNHKMKSHASSTRRGSRKT